MNGSRPAITKQFKIPLSKKETDFVWSDEKANQMFLRHSKGGRTGEDEITSVWILRSPFKMDNRWAITVSPAAQALFIFKVIINAVAAASSQWCLCFLVFFYHRIVQLKLSSVSDVSTCRGGIRAHRKNMLLIWVSISSLEISLSFSFSCHSVIVCFWVTSPKGPLGAREELKRDVAEAGLR